MKLYQNIVEFIRGVFDETGKISLHEPVFTGNEKKYLADCIDSTFVSYVGKYVSRFEQDIKGYSGAKYAVATVSGTSALHIALLVSGVSPGDEVLAPGLTFVATVNAISYCNATPVFVDSNKSTLGMDPDLLEAYLNEHALVKDDGHCYNNDTGKIMRACIPVHVFGHPAEMDRIMDVCGRYNITVIEDAAESLGSTYRNQHTGTFGRIGVLSFNGNKIITTGGGGMIITDDEELAKKALHITTTAKVPHAWEYNHDEIAYNYRMPNVNAAIGCAQLEQLKRKLLNKRELAHLYHQFCQKNGYTFISEPVNCQSNYWLNAILMRNKQERDQLLAFGNEQNILLRPTWTIMTKLDIYKNCPSADLSNAIWLADRLVNLPSSVRI